MLELTIVLVMTSILVAFLLTKISARETEARLQVLRANVEEVQAAIEIFARQRCNIGVYSTPTIPQLVAEGSLMSSQNAVNPFTKQVLGLAIVWTPPIRHSVSATFPSPQMAIAYSGATDASRVSGSTLYWDRTVTSTISNDSEGAVQFRNMFETGCL